MKNEISEVRELLPILLKTYRDDDPLALAIEIRRENWMNYDPDNDRATRGNQEAIVHDLETKGFTNRQASSIEMVACPIKR